MITYWWFRPSRIALFVVMPLSWCAFLASNTFYQEFKAFNAISGEEFLLVWLSLLGFASASWLGEVLRGSKPINRLPYVQSTTFRAVLGILATIAIAATLIFVWPFVTHPAFVMSVIKGEPGAIFTVRDYADQISGITSLGNLLNLVVVLFLIKPRLTGRRRSSSDKAVLFFIFGLAAFKAVMHGERTGLIELLVPLALLTIARRPRSQVLAMAPVLGFAALYLLFLTTEYLRSYVAYVAEGRSQASEGVALFMLERLMAYYLTAINNGAYIYGSAHSYFFPIFTGEWLWHMPIPHLREFLSNLTGTHIDITAILSGGLDVEFNNTSGIFAPLIDFGPILGVAVWTVLGYLSGRLYRAFSEGHYLGLILFPTWYVGILELPRVFYWGDNRYFPTLVCSIAISLVFVYLLPTVSSDALRRPRVPLGGRYPAPDGARTPNGAGRTWLP